MKYKIGDKVRVCKDLEEKRYLGEDECTVLVRPEMLAFRGKKAIITEVWAKGYYISICDRRWLWTDSMFRELELSFRELMKAKGKILGPHIAFTYYPADDTWSIVGGDSVVHGLPVKRLKKLLADVVEGDDLVTVIEHFLAEQVGNG